MPGDWEARLDEVSDVYAVGEPPYARWRSFADASRPWSPEGFHNDLLRKRDFHARNAYELGLLLAITPEYTCRESLEYLRVCAVVELRVCEIELASFQLSHRQIGLMLTSPDDVYAAAAFMYGAHLHLFDQLSKAQKYRRGRKNVLAMTPYRTDSPRVLAERLDQNLHALHLLLQSSMQFLKLATDEVGNMLAPTRRLGQLLGLAMRALDKVVRVYDN